MSKFVYCSNCGTKLPRYRKAVKGLGKIIDLIEPHECTEEPVPLDFEPTEHVEYVEGKFVEKLNDLKPHGLVGSVSTMDLRDRRVESAIKSSAPPTVLDQIKSMTPSTPEGDLED